MTRPATTPPQSSGASITTPDWAPPTTPSGLSATAVSSSEIDLSWQAATDNVGVAGYSVFRNGSAVATLGPGVLTYADTGLGHGVTYSYTVTAFDVAGNTSPQSSPASATTPDDIAPTTPGGLSASATSSTSVSVSWTASSDNVAVTGYDVYRDGAPLATVGAGTLAYTDTVAVGSTHGYTVDAFDAAGNHSATPGGGHGDDSDLGHHAAHDPDRPDGDGAQLDPGQSELGRRDRQRRRRGLHRVSERGGHRPPLGAASCPTPTAL